MKRTRTLINSALAATFAVSGIVLTGLHATAAPAQAKVSINLAGWASTPSEPDNLRKVIASFEKAYPNIKVNYQVVNGDFETQMKTRVAAGTAPDVFYADEGWVQVFERAGQLMPLTNLAKSDKNFHIEDFYKGLLAGFTYKKQIYGFPKDYSTLAMWYNKDMFAKAGISKPPTTWAQFQTDACKLTDKANNVYGTVLAADPARWLPFVQEAGGTLLNKQQTKATIDSAAGRTALNFYAGLVKKGCATDPASAGATWSGEAFGKGRAAMVFEGNWLQAPMHDSYPSIKWGLASIPKGPKGYGNLAFSVAYVIYNKTKHPKEAWDLLSYLTGRQGMAQWVKLGGYLPGRKTIKAPAGSEVFVKGAKYARSWSFPPGFDQALTKIGNDILSTFKGQMSVPQAITQMQTDANTVLSGP